MTQPQAIDEIARRLVEYYRPERIYLFGSAARGEFGPDSDLDFCALVPYDAPERLLCSGAIYGELRGVGYPADVIPWRRTDFDARAAHVITSLPATIVREGRLIYDAQGPDVFESKANNGDCFIRSRNPISCAHTMNCERRRASRERKSASLTLAGRIRPS